MHIEFDKKIEGVSADGVILAGIYISLYENFRTYVTPLARYFLIVKLIDKSKMTF